MKFVLLLLFFVCSSQLWSQVARVSIADEEINLNDFCYSYQDNTRNLPIHSIIELSGWTKLSGNGPSIGIQNKVQWVKIEVKNTSNVDLAPYLYLPLKLVKKLDVYLVRNSEVLKVIELGTNRTQKNTHLSRISDAILMEIPPLESTTVYLRFEHDYQFIESPIFLVNKQRLENLTSNNETILLIWWSVYLFSLLIALVFFLLTKLKVFLFYFLGHLGIAVIIFSRTGGFFTFFPIDSYDVILDLRHLGSSFSFIFSIYFLNELVPIFSIFPVLCKWLKRLFFLSALLSIIILIPGVKSTRFLSITTVIVIASSLLFTGSMSYVFAVAIRRKHQHSIPFFFLSVLFLLGIIAHIVLPKTGIINSNAISYNSLLAVSLIGLIVRLYLAALDTLNVYKERTLLLELQRNHQTNITNAIVESQESERNKIGQDLHDHIGANLSIIKQRISENDPKLQEITRKTIETIRNISQGLVTPNLNNEFQDEIADLCLLLSNENLSVHSYFNLWPEIGNASVSTHIFRICQEMLQNALKHSEAKNVYLQFIGGDEFIIIMYEDDGIGFDPDLKSNKGIGLQNIVNRIELLKGEIEIDSSIQHGSSTITINIPFYHDN